jgi:GDP-4-dehydro-6-deoxy-D-mannose reductase
MPPATLVTGAAGFAGGHLLELLSRDPAGHVAAWHRPGGTPPRDVPHTTWNAVDLLDRTAVRDAVARLRPSIVYHCAGEAHVVRARDRIDAAFAINVRGTHHLLDALERERVAARVLLPSSALVYQPSDVPLREDNRLCPPNPYGLSKLAQEMLGGHAIGGVEVCIARPFNHIGPRQNPFFAAPGFARRIADIERGLWQPVITVGNLEAKRELTDVRDTVRAYVAIVERGRPGRPYNVCTGEAVAIRHLLDLLIARARVQVTVEVDPSRYRPNDTPILVGDPSRLRDEIGWAPQISLEQTVDDLLAYWRNQAP